MKKDLALAALDAESTVDTVEMTRNSDDLKKRLEVCWVQSPRPRWKRPPRSPSRRPPRRRQRIRPPRPRRLRRRGDAGGRVPLLGELVAQDAAAAPPPEETVAHVRNRLDECLTTDEAGRPRLTFTLPDKAAIDGLAKTLARLVAMGPGG